MATITPRIDHRGQDLLRAVECSGVLYATHKCPYPHGRCRKISWMQQEEETLSRRRFLKLCFAAMAGLSLLSLAGCGGGQGDGEGGGGNGNGKKNNEDDGGGGGGGY
jgi:hypothetical protein